MPFFIFTNVQKNNNKQKSVARNTSTTSIIRLFVKTFSFIHSPILD